MLLLPTLAALVAGFGSHAIEVNRSVAGVALGMTRTQVVRTLGQPQKDTFGVLDFAPGAGFTVFLEQGRVRWVLVALPGFCTADRICTGAPGGLAKLTKRYGSALRPYRTEASAHGYLLFGSLAGRPVFTNFEVSGSVVEKVTVSYCNPAICTGTA
jgi:hypothetical protein